MSLERAASRRGLTASRLNSTQRVPLPYDDLKLSCGNKCGLNRQFTPVLPGAGAPVRQAAGARWISAILMGLLALFDALVGFVEKCPKFPQELFPLGWFFC